MGEHTNIPTLNDYFVAAAEQYLVQEFIGGDNLERELSTAGAWREKEVRQLLRDLLPIIQFVHDRLVVHRDIKPENIVRRQSDRALVLVDFGAAKVATDKTATVIGSAAYTAPEQLKGKAVLESDLYSLGVTCIHLLTQVHPFDLYDSGENEWKWRDYLEQPVSDRLGKILDKMLEGATNKRYQSANEILQDLQTRSAKVKHTGRKIAGVSAAFILALLGLRALVSPVVKKVSPPTVQQPISTPDLPEINSDLGGLYGYLDGQVQTLPLKNTSVTAKIAGNLSRVEVR